MARDRIMLLIVASCFANIIVMQLTHYPHTAGIVDYSSLSVGSAMAHLIFALIPTVPLLMIRARHLAMKAYSEKMEAERRKPTGSTAEVAAEFDAYRGNMTGRNVA